MSRQNPSQRKVTLWKGDIHVFTGDGKGKTTAALGMAWRAIGQGRKVFIVQFLKAPDTSGEHFTAKVFEPLLTLKPMGQRGFIRGSSGDALAQAKANAALESARKALLSGKYDLIVLDEVNVAVHLGLVEVQDLLALIDAKPPSLALVLTGRYVHSAVIERADVIFEMQNVKHHFDQGVTACKGIEY